MTPKYLTDIFSVSYYKLPLNFYHLYTIYQTNLYHVKAFLNKNHLDVMLLNILVMT